MSKPNQLRDTIVIIVGIMAILMLLRHAQSIVVPLLLSAFIAIIAATPVGMLKKRGFSVPFAVTIVSLMFLLFELVAILILGNTFERFSQALPKYQLKLDTLLQKFSNWLLNFSVDISETGILQILDPKQAIDLANILVMSIGEVLSNALLIMFTVLFILLEAWDFPAKLQAMKGVSEAAVLKEFTKIIDSTKHYIAMKAFSSLITGIFVAIGLAFVGLDFAILWGFVAFSLNFIPNIGSIVAAVPAVLLSILQLDPASTIIVIGIYLGVNTLIGNVLEPQVMGRSVGLSTLVVFLSLIFWGWFLGPVGMLLSVPLTMVIKFSTQANENSAWIAVLLAPAPDTNIQVEQEN
ncbi:MAG: AI-2E family transporter [Gammaproteobacteria bacterium]